MKEKLRKQLQTTYYFLRNQNYENEFLPTKKTVEDSSFKSFELYNLHGNDALLKQILSTVDSEDTFIDVGANTGTYSLAVKGKDEDIDVHSFEANPETYEKLIKNMNLNSFNIKAYNQGLSSIEADLNFHIADYNELSGFDREHIHDLNGEIEKTVEVPVSTLDNYCNRTNTIPDQVKVDVEGHELQVLTGSRNVLERYEPDLFVEYHPQSSADVEFEDVLTRLPESYEVVEHFDDYSTHLKSV